MRARLLAAGAAIALAITVIATLSVTTPAMATVRITSDPGGRMNEYATRFLQVRQSGERVVIDGICLSACTMVLGLVPHERVCATGRAVLGFHAAWQPDGRGGRVTSPPATEALFDTYPPAVRAWIARRGGLTPKMIFMRGSDLAGIVAPCASITREASVRATKRPSRLAQRPGSLLRADLRRTTVAARQ